jgi:hypothetical protein
VLTPTGFAVCAGPPVADARADKRPHRPHQIHRTAALGRSGAAVSYEEEAAPKGLALEVVLFVAGGLALLAAGQPAFGVALAVLGIANALLVRALGTASGDRA